MSRRADSIPTQAEDWHRNVDRHLWHDAPEDTTDGEGLEAQQQPCSDDSASSLPSSAPLPSTHAQCLAHPSMLLKRPLEKLQADSQHPSA